MVSVDELQKVVADITSDKVNPLEAPSIIPSVTQVKAPIQTTVGKSTKVDTNTKFDTSEKFVTIEKK